MFKYYFCLFLIIVLSSCNPSQDKVHKKNDPICLPSQSQCKIELPVGTFTVKFAVDKNVITEMPFNIEISYFQQSTQQGSETLKVKKIMAYLEGKEMFMGKIPVLFSPASSPTPTSSSSEIKNSFTGETMLGSCSDDQMTWRLWITAELENKTQTETISKTFFVEFDSTRF